MLALAETSLVTAVDGFLLVYAEAGSRSVSRVHDRVAVLGHAHRVSGLEVTGAATLFIVVPRRSGVASCPRNCLLLAAALTCWRPGSTVKSGLAVDEVASSRRRLLVVGAYLVAHGDRRPAAGPRGHRNVWDTTISLLACRVSRSLLAVSTSFGGLEIVTIAASGPRIPRRHDRAIRSVVTRILVLRRLRHRLLIPRCCPGTAEAMRRTLIAQAGVPAVRYAHERHHLRG